MFVCAGGALPVITRRHRRSPVRPTAAVVEADTGSGGDPQRPSAAGDLGLGAANRESSTLIDRLEAPASTTYQERCACPRRILFLWPGFGDAAPAFAREISPECDATLAIGCRFVRSRPRAMGRAPGAHWCMSTSTQRPSVRNHKTGFAIQSDAPLRRGVAAASHAAPTR